MTTAGVGQGAIQGEGRDLRRQRVCCSRGLAGRAGWRRTSAFGAAYIRPLTRT